MSSDNELVEEIKNGNHSAMEVLINRHYKPVFAYVYRKIGDYHLAYDLTQEIFIKVVKSIHTFKPEGTFQNWLLTIAVNHCRDYFRNRSFQDSKQVQHFKYPIEDDKSSVWDLFNRKSEHKRVTEALQSLPDFQREAIILKFYHGLKIKEIAAITNSNESTVKSRLKQGIEKLRLKLKGGNQYEKKQKVVSDEEALNHKLMDMEKELNEYLVKYPDSNHIQSTIESLHQYVPNPAVKQVPFGQKTVKLLKLSLSELLFMNKLYWVTSFILFILGYFVTLSQSYNPAMTLFVLAPLPFVIGLVELFKGREQGMLEIEMSCKFSAHKIMLSRLLIISMFNIILNIILTISFKPLFDGENILRMISVWFLPLIIFSALALWLNTNVRGVLFNITFVFLWLITSITIINNPVWIQNLLTLPISLFMSAMLFGIGLFTYQVIQLTKKYSIYDGEDTYEFNY